MEPIPERAPHEGPDPLAAIMRWQPELFGPRKQVRDDGPPPVSAENLSNCFGWPEVSALAAMSPDQRACLPRDSWFGAILYYLEAGINSPFWAEWSYQFRRAQKVQALTEKTGTALALAQLDRSRISVDWAWRDSAAQNWRFGAVKAERAAWLRVLPQCEPNASSVLRTFRCGLFAVVKRHRESGQFKIESETCGKRTCPVCALRHKMRTAERLRAALAGEWKAHEWRFITLTLRADGESLAARLTRLQKSFRRLRQQQIWLQTQSDGIAVIEIKYSEKLNNWHVHLHVLARGRYIDKAALSAAWLQATGDSFVVDIRAVSDREGAIKYLCKYVGKGPTSEGAFLSDELLGDWYVGIKRKRLLIGYGALKKLPEVTDEEPEDRLPNEWEWVAPLGEILREAAAGDPVARKILDAIRIENTTAAARAAPWFGMESKK